MSNNMDKDGCLDCGDNSCFFANEKGGMRTNGGCRCLGDMGLGVEEKRAIRKTYIRERARANRLEGIIGGKSLGGRS